MNNSSSNSDVVEYTATAPGKIELVGLHFVMQVIIRFFISTYQQEDYIDWEVEDFLVGDIIQ